MPGYCDNEHIRDILTGMIFHLSCPLQIHICHTLGKYENSYLFPESLDQVMMENEYNTSAGRRLRMLKYFRVSKMEITS